MIYLIVDEHRHFCKIGFTELEIEQRLLMLQTGNPQKLFLVGLIDGDEEKESDIHNMFVRFHKRGEWFFYHQTILDYFYGQPDHYVSSVVDIIPLSFRKKVHKKEKKDDSTKILQQLILPSSAGNIDKQISDLTGKSIATARNIKKELVDSGKLYTIKQGKEEIFNLVTNN